MTVRDRRGCNNVDVNKWTPQESESKINDASQRNKPQGLAVKHVRVWALVSQRELKGLAFSKILLWVSYWNVLVEWAPEDFFVKFKVHRDDSNILKKDVDIFI